MKRKFSPLLVLLLCCCLAIQSAAAALSSVNSASMEWLHASQTEISASALMHEHHLTNSAVESKQHTAHTANNQDADIQQQEPAPMDCCDCDCEANCVMGCHPATILTSIQFFFPDRKHFHSKLSSIPPSINPQEALRPPIRH